MSVYVSEEIGELEYYVITESGDERIVLKRENIDPDNRIVVNMTDVERLSDRVDTSIVDVVGDFGADPTGASDDNTPFANAIAELHAAGGGLIQLRARCLHNANIDLTGGRVDIAGHGVLSRIKGIAGAGKPIIDKDQGIGSNFIRNLQLIGNRGGLLGPGIEPLEIGIRLGPHVASGAWAPHIENVTILGTGAAGLQTNTPSHVSKLRTFWTGGPGVYAYFGSFDSYYDQVDVGGVRDGLYGIQAWGTQSQWTNCQSYAGGARASIIGVPGSQWDPSRDDFYGWSWGWMQTARNCVSEDNPVGHLIVGGDNDLDLTSGGDHRGMRFAIPTAGTSEDNDVRLKIRINDAFMPEYAVDAEWAGKARIYVTVDWEHANTIGNSVTPPALGVPLRDTAFEVFHNVNLANQYKNAFVLGGQADQSVFHTASDGALTPDVADGLNYYISLDADITINALTHRKGLSIGQVVRFFFAQNSVGGHVVNWNSGWGDSCQPSMPASSQTIMEYVQNDNAFAYLGFLSLRRRRGIIDPLVGPTIWPTLLEWLDVSQLQAVAPGTGIATLPFKSTTGVNVAQATVGSQPLLTPGAFGNFPGARFDGVDDYMTSAAFTSAIAQPLTMYFVARLNKVLTGAGQSQVLVDGISAGRVAFYQSVVSGVPKWTVYAGSVPYAVNGTPDIIPHVFTVVMNPSGTTRVYIDNVDMGGGSGVGTQTFAGVTIGAQSGGGGQYAAMDFGGLLVFSGAHSAGMRQAVFQSLATKWRVGTLLL